MGEDFRERERETFRVRERETFRVRERERGNEGSGGLNNFSCLN